MKKTKSTSVVETVNDLVNLVKPDMTEQDFKVVKKWFNKNHGCLSKCVSFDGTEIVGYLVRIEDEKNPLIIYNGYFAADFKNRFFNKAKAMIQTVIKGRRYIKEQQKKNNNERVFDRTFLNNFSYLKDFDIINKEQNISFNLEEFFKKHNICFTSDEYYHNSIIGNDGSFYDQEFINFMIAFEEKSQRYYKNYDEKRRFVSIPFYNDGKKVKI